MGMSMIPLLMVSDSISPAARDALREVTKAPPEQRAAKRMAAARVLFSETDLDCTEVKDLMGFDRDDLSHGARC